MGKSQSKSSVNGIPSKSEYKAMKWGAFSVATFDALIGHLDTHMKAVPKNETSNKEILREAMSIVEKYSADFQDDFELKIHLSRGVFIYHNGDRSIELDVEWKSYRVVSEFSTITGGDIHIARFTALVADLAIKLRKVRKSDTNTREILQEAQEFVAREKENIHLNYELKVHLPSGILTYHNGDRSMEMTVECRGDRVVSEFSTITGGDINCAKSTALVADLEVKLRKVRKSDTKTRAILQEAQEFVARENENFHVNYELKVHLPSGILTYHNGDRSMPMRVMWKGDMLVSECSTIPGGDIQIGKSTALEADLNAWLLKSRSDTKMRKILLEARAFFHKNKGNFEANFELKVHLPTVVLTYYNGDRSIKMYVEMKGDRVESGYSSSNQPISFGDIVQNGVGIMCDWALSWGVRQLAL